jgi:hypothetical protein
VTYFIDLRADSAGGNPVANFSDVVVRTEVEQNPNPSRSLEPALLQAIQGRDVLLAAHGFHVNRADGIANLSHWTRWLDLGANGFFVGVLWPGDARWVPFIDYPFEGNEAIKSGQLLADYLNAKFAGVNSLSFSSHSLGARVILEAIGKIAKSFSQRTFTSMAAAIDDTCLVNEYKDAAAQLQKISVLASKCDDVLKLAFPAGNLVGGIVARGDPYWHGALGRFGPNPGDQPSKLWKAPVLPDSWNFGHASYINCFGPGFDSQPEAASVFPPAVVVPSPGTPPLVGANWQQAWAAGFVSTRFL